MINVGIVRKQIPIEVCRDLLILSCHIFYHMSIYSKFVLGVCSYRRDLKSNEFELAAVLSSNQCVIKQITKVTEYQSHIDVVYKTSCCYKRLVVILFSHAK